MPGHRVLRHAFLLLALTVLVVLVLTGSRTGEAGLLGAVTGVAGYVLALRWGVWPWLAAVASLPALLAPTSFAAAPLALALLTAALLALAWAARPRPAVLGLGLLLLAASATVLVVRSGHPTKTLGTASLVALGCCVVLALAAVLGLGRARGSKLRAACALTAVAPALLLVGAAGGVRGGQLGVLVLWPLAGALGLTALLRGRRGRATARPQADEHDAAAVAAYHERYADPSLAPVAVVIAAYNEADGLPDVLAEMPSSVCGLDVDVLVVDDGSTDGTAGAVESTGHARLVVSPVNRGQGAALRLGYLVARQHGARYVITTDADGQYDPADFPAVLAPVLERSADFVTGSRRLGHQETRDRVRRLGVHVFAWTVSALTGHWSTDTSFGLRAMRVEVLDSVTLNQPQYQSSELMIGVLSHGWRVAEVPGRMRVRSAGVTKKGKNLVYGRRYAGVVLGTWWREGAPAPVTDRAPALVERA